MNDILSLFDGMSCARIALDRAGIKYDNYYASEINSHSIKAAKNAYPDTIQIGDVTKADGKKYKGKIKILMGGSPCQGFSLIGKRLHFEDERSKLIIDFFRILAESEPKYFLLENVVMDKNVMHYITTKLNVMPVKINSSLVSGQSRKRLYWTNIPGRGFDLFGATIEQPPDKKIMLKNILQPENEIDEKYYLRDIEIKRLKKDILEKRGYCKINGEKTRALLTQYGTNVNGTFICKELFNIYKKGVAGRVYDPDYKSITLKASGGGGGAKTGLYLTNKRIRKLTPIECCRLQNVPDNYFDGSSLSDNQIYKCLGDGWTIDIITHILGGIK